MNFENWYIENLIVGAYPIINNDIDLKTFDIVINVSDEIHFEVEDEISKFNCRSYWFPMNEAKKDIGLNSIFGALIILYNAELNNKKVYLHCHAGIHRSQLVKSCYYFMRMKRHNIYNYGSFINPMYSDCARGLLPPRNEMEEFLLQLGFTLDKFNSNLNGGYLDLIKINTIKNF